ncbi:hypothetical protein Lser_V15G37347 [Lactuca serriola]
MASSSSSPSAMAFSSQLWKYHVFLSFRGEDTRKTFVDHLYMALVQQGIYTYKDDETLPRGESIAPSLEKAIEESQIVVIIFSKNYADSSWCLDELVHIMKCKDMRDQIVMPIFYDVDPSEVRKQKRKYGEAFAKHELENKTKVESWRKALVDAANVSGWESQHIANGFLDFGIVLQGFMKQSKDPFEVAFEELDESLADSPDTHDEIVAQTLSSKPNINSQRDDLENSIHPLNKPKSRVGFTSTSAAIPTNQKNKEDDDE